MRFRAAKLFLVLALAVAAGVLALPAVAQTTGAIDGTVSDGNGAPLPGVKMEVKSTSLQGTRTVVTDSQGRFRLPVLPPGTYTVTASLTGFRSAQRTGIVNVVTKSGGNQFKGDVFGYFDMKSLIAERKGTAESDVNYTDQSQRNVQDYGADLGGFFMKDRIWFFGAYNRISQQVDQVPLAGTGLPNAGVVFPISYAANIWSAKLTIRPTDSMVLVGTAFGDPRPAKVRSGIGPPATRSSSRESATSAPPTTRGCCRSSSAPEASQTSGTPTIRTGSRCRASRTASRSRTSGWIRTTRSTRGDSATSGATDRTTSPRGRTSRAAGRSSRATTR